MTERRQSQIKWWATVVIPLIIGSTIGGIATSLTFYGTAQATFAEQKLTNTAIFQALEKKADKELLQSEIQANAAAVKANSEALSLKMDRSAFEAFEKANTVDHQDIKRGVETIQNILLKGHDKALSNN